MDDTFVVYYEPFLGVWVVKLAGMTSYASAVLFEHRNGLHLKVLRKEGDPHNELTQYMVRYDKYISQHAGWERVNYATFRKGGDLILG